MSNETLIRHCAPTMARLKTGNLFTCAFDSPQQMTCELRLLNRRLGRKGLRILPMRHHKGKVLLYVYRPRLLERDLQHPLARRLLQECGYTCDGVGACVAQLMARLRSGGEFPHEIGLFLGYPPADVDGFMHQKSHCRLCGLWKVYDDVEGALLQFDRCRHCTEVYLNCLARGFSLDRLAVAE